MAIAVFSVCLSASAAFDTKDWTWTRPISAAVAQSQFVRLPLPLDVLDTSQPSLADLRVLDQREDLVPYVVRWAGGHAISRVEWKSTGLLNPVFQPQQYSRVTVDLGDAVPRNRIKIVTDGANFRRRVTVEGSSDGASWDILLENGWLFDVPLPDKACRVDELSFPTSNFRHLRITVFNMPDDPRRIEITSVQTARWTETPETPLIPVAVKASSPQFDEKTHQNVYDLDLGYRNVPVATLEVTVSDRFYHRAYELEGRNAEKIQTQRRTETKWETEEREAPWTSIARGVLYRVQHEDKTAESNTIVGVRAAYRYLRLRVFEQDNPPLVIPSIAVKRWDVGVVFEYTPGESYSLIGGNAAAAAPSFDLAIAQRGLDRPDLPAATAGEPRFLEKAATPGPWSERYAVLLWAALILAVGTVLALILKNLGKLKGA
ncbi:MAG: DUF3999 family protein [Candidatus Hydrogenedentes bacterium]|nr:DUF3999 family protein [Candidatus Hydrogenedentota bacterium]